MMNRFAETNALERDNIRLFVGYSLTADGAFPSVNEYETNKRMTLNATIFVYSLHIR